MKKMDNVNYVRFTDNEVVECKHDREKLEKLVANSVGFVKKAIKGIYLTSDNTYEDKMQIAYESFIKAVKKFELGKGADFYTFAYMSIRHDLIDFHAASKRAKRGYNKETESYTKVASLDMTIGDEENDTLGAMIVDEQANTYAEAFGLESRLEKIYEMLSPAQTYVFTEYFLQEKTMKEIAEAHGVTTTRVGNLTKQIVKKITERYTMEQFAELIAR